MELEQLGDVDVRDPVAIGEHERAVVQPRPQPAHAPSRVRIAAGVHEMDPPTLGELLGGTDLPVGEIDGHRPGHQRVVEEVALDDLALVAERDAELVKP